MAAELVRQLHYLGVTLDVAVFDNGGRGDRQILDIVKPYVSERLVLPCRGRLDFSTVVALRRYIIRRQVNVLHSHKYKATFYSLLARLRTSCKLVVTYHNWLTNSLPLRVYAALDKRLAAYCDAAVGVSVPVAQELRRSVLAKRVHHIGNGVDTQIYQRVLTLADAKRALGLPVNSRSIGFVGRLSAAKGVSYLLQAAAALSPALRGDAHIVIVGDGEHRKALADEARLLGLSQRTHFLGTRSDTPLIYSALDVFVLPSEVEAFPMVVLEAMACALPVIATNVGDVGQIIENGTSGRVIAARDKDALRTAVEEVLIDPDYARRLGTAARERIAQQFSSSQMAQRYLVLYRDVLATRRQ